MYKPTISMEKIRECLERSGYLMESRLVNSLTDKGYFVEPNQVLRDPRTGKSREIDIIAEHFVHKPERKNVCVKTHFVVEAINNIFPFVLLTKRPFSPNADYDSYIKYVTTPDPNLVMDSIDIYEARGNIYDNLYSQYCVLTHKSGKKEFIATHPDDVYGSLLKLSEYIEEEIYKWIEYRNTHKEKYYRLFFWQPILVLSGQLIGTHVRDNGDIDLEEIDIGRLEFNWHAGDEHKTTVIEVVTENHFINHVSKTIKQDDVLEGMAHDKDIKLYPGATT